MSVTVVIVVVACAGGLSVVGLGGIFVYLKNRRSKTPGAEKQRHIKALRAAIEANNTSAIDAELSYLEPGPPRDRDTELVKGLDEWQKEGLRQVRIQEFEMRQALGVCSFIPISLHYTILIDISRICLNDV